VFLLVFSSEAPFYRRQFILFNFNVPEGMLEHGIRDYVVSNVGGLELAGFVQRIVSNEEGQCILVSVIGKKSDLDSFEQNFIDTELWEYNIRANDPRNSFSSNRSFKIIPSSRGAKKGPGSDSRCVYDYLSVAEKMTNKTSSSKRSDDLNEL
jgi:hypothetical protein